MQDACNCNAYIYSCMLPCMHLYILTYMHTGIRGAYKFVYQHNIKGQAVARSQIIEQFFSSIITVVQGAEVQSVHQCPPATHSLHECVGPAPTIPWDIVGLSDQQTS